MTPSRNTGKALALSLLICAGLVSPPSNSLAGDGAFPSGRLSLTTSALVLGSYPRLEWDIHPSAIAGQVEVEDSGRLSLLRDALMNVRVIGVSPGVSNVGESAPKVELRLQINGGGFSQIFFDSEKRGLPGELANQSVLSSSDLIDFGARIQNGAGEWSGWFSTAESANHVVALKNGDTIPNTIANAAPPKFLLPYLDVEGKVQIGPNELLVMMEAGTADTQNAGYDQSDVAVLVSFDSSATQ